MCHRVPPPPRGQTCRPQTSSHFGAGTAGPGPGRASEEEGTGAGTASPLGPGPGGDWARDPSIAQGRGWRWRGAGGAVRHRRVRRFVAGEGEGREAAAAAGPRREGGERAGTLRAGEEAGKRDPKEGKCRAGVSQRRLSHGHGSLCLSPQMVNRARSIDRRELLLKGLRFPRLASNSFDPTA